MATSEKVRIADSLFGVLDGYDIPTPTADWSNGLIAVMASGALVGTGINRGHVRVSVDLRSEPPEALDPGTWDDIVEVSVNAPSGNLAIQQLEYGPAESTPPLPLLSFHGPGTYRLRVHVRGRDEHPDAVCDDSGEEYLLTIWPGPWIPALIIRATDQCGYGLRLSALTNAKNAPPPPPPTPEEPVDKGYALRRAALLNSMAAQPPGTDATA